MKDEFRGDTPHLVSSIEALLSLDAAGALVPHGIGGHARDLLSAAAVRLSAGTQEAYRQGYEQGWHDRACNSPHAYLAAAPHQAPEAPEAQGDRHDK